MLHSRSIVKSVLGAVFVVAAGCAHGAGEHPHVTPAQLEAAQQSANIAAANAAQAQRTADEALKKATAAQASANQVAQAADDAKATAARAEELSKATEEKTKRMMTKAMQK